MCLDSESVTRWPHGGFSVCRRKISSPCRFADNHFIISALRASTDSMTGHYWFECDAMLFRIARRLERVPLEVILESVSHGVYFLMDSESRLRPNVRLRPRRLTLASAVADWKRVGQIISLRHAARTGARSASVAGSCSSCCSTAFS